MRRFMIFLIALTITVGLMAPSAAAATSARPELPTCTPQAAIDKMVSYIRTQQQPDGSFPSIGQSSTADATYALVASRVGGTP